jgi:septal ring factor EnvC (AmiA/AmiB activator)
VALLASVNSEVRVPLMPQRRSGEIALDYYALYDAVKSEFEHVRMLGQAPFVGYVIADFAPEGTPEPTLDSAFLPNGAEEPELFIALASQHAIELEAFTVVQLPYRSLGSAEPTDSDALRRLRGKLGELEGELAGERASGAQRDVKVRELETQVFARDAELAALRQELEHKTRLIEEHQANLAELSVKLEQAPSPEEEQTRADELSALERTLVERGEQIRKLQQDLRETERTAKELARKLPVMEAADAARKNTENDLAQKLAKAEADLVATRWALEAAVKRTGAAPNEAPKA